MPGSKATLAKTNDKNVPIVGMSDKRMITATFSMSLDGKFLPMQIIYGGKTSKSIPSVKFSETFSLSANPKRYSNETEAPYFEAERRNLGLPENYPALVIFDVFKGQTTDAYLDKLEAHAIKY